MNRTFVRRGLLASAVAAALSITAVAMAADVPQTLTHQGRLYDDTGAPVKGSLAVTFNIYDAADAATPIWSETMDVPFDDGYFSASLGQKVPFAGIFDGSALYMGIQVGADPEMKPRVDVNSVPYALVAGNAIGDITPTSVSINGATVIDATGKWVGDTTGITGPAGKDGAIGPMGPQGLPGAIGPTGPIGPVGPAGAIGPTGAIGPQGAVGPAGAIGPVGPAGAIGPTGAIGPQGAVGPAGAIGPTGAIGPVGPAGAIGPAGALGPTGATGATGAIGPAGATGATGAIGPVGPAGAIGPTGAIGPQGAVGPVGPAGAIGPTGAIGPVGPAGAVGATGAIGPVGPAGAVGATGLVATAALAGSAGVSIAGNSTVYVFVGPTAQVTTTATQRLTGAAEAPLGLATGSAATTGFVGLCYQSTAAGSVINNFVGGNYSVHRFVGGREAYPAVGTVVPGAGTYNVGYCVRNLGVTAITDNDWVNGYVQVTN